jgi:hypothetical protein
VLLGRPSIVDAINTFGVSAGHFASFRVVSFDISAVHRDFCDGFDSRQPHQKNSEVRAESRSMYHPTRWHIDGTPNDWER